jgi:hypothetical protein
MDMMGCNNSEHLGINCRKKFTIPQKRCTLFLVLGRSHSSILTNFFILGLIPLGSNQKPSNGTLLQQKKHLSQRIVRLTLVSASKTLFTCTICSSYDLLKMIISSIKLLEKLEHPFSCNKACIMRWNSEGMCLRPNGGNKSKPSITNCEHSNISVCFP